MKKWYKSRTILVNLLTLAAGVLAVFQGTDWIMANPQMSAAIMAAIAAVNVYLRKNTDVAIQ
jgi:hypothetical protein